jgi:putative phosphoserine phosphatase/1-acylglycerol-3-phosphate O-acyltransferase
MRTRTDLTGEIRTGPAGPKVGAFFDLDRTLLAGFSSVMFFRQQLMSGRLAPRDLLEILSAAVSFELGQIGFSGLVTGAMNMLRGRSETALEELGEQIFEDQFAGAIYPEARALVQAHQHRGHTLAIVSSATRFQIEPLARDLGIEHVLCTQLETREGVFTGKVVRPTCYREGKAVAAREFAVLSGVDLEESYFYTDSDEDLPLLEAVGRPRPINPNSGLAEIAARRGWPVRRFTSRGTPGLGEVLRTGLAAGSVVPSFLVGLPVALLNRTRRQAVNLGVTAFGELATALAGIDLRVEGEQHLWSERPAVFIFNHQSAIDPLLVCRLLRRDFVGIARRRVRWNPVAGLLLAAAGTIFVDDFDRDGSEPPPAEALHALQRGLSIAVTPEGKRSPSPRLGSFEEGAFRLAMAEMVPVVPIVFRNTCDALPRGGAVIRPAEIDVVVRPPVSTEGWTAAGLRDEIEGIRRLYVETLDD